MANYKLLKKKNSLIQTSLINRLGLIAILAIFLTGCDGNQLTSPVADTDRNAEIYISDSKADKKYEGVDSELIKNVKRATARYHSTTQAVRAGYESAGHCVEDPDKGGMGYHWVKESLVDPVFDPANPEALLYEPDKNGNLKLVGVEYIVIDTAEGDDIGQNPPYFGDHPFDVGGTPIPVAHYSLHVWLYKDNPNGMFEPYNPKVSC